MFTKNNVSKSMIDAVESVLAEDKKLLLEPETEKKDRKKNDDRKQDVAEGHESKQEYHDRMHRIAAAFKDMTPAMHAKRKKIIPGWEDQYQEVLDYVKKNPNKQQGVAEGLTEMDKSQTPPGRDGGTQFPPGPKVSKKDREAAKKDPAKHLSNLFAREYDKKKQGVASGSLNELKKSTVKSYADKKQAELDDVPPMPFKKPAMSKAEHEKAAKGMTGALARLSGQKPTSQGVAEELKGNQVKLDKNHNGKLDAQDFKLLRMKKEEILNSMKPGAKKVTKQNEEVEQIDELKKSTLASYAKKATDDVSYHSFSAGSRSEKDPERLKDDEKSMKRQAGVSKAIDRLAKEEVEQIDEFHYDPGMGGLAAPIVGAIATGKVVQRGRAWLKDKLDAHKAKKAAQLEKQKTEPKNEEVETVEEDIGAMQSVVGEDKGKKSVRVDTLKGPTISNDPEVKNANAHFSGKKATLKAEGKGTDTAVPFVTDSVSPTHREINKAVKPTFKKIKEMLGKTGTSE